VNVVLNCFFIFYTVLDEVFYIFFDHLLTDVRRYYLIPQAI
jgi:hypothetical protein